MLPEEADMFSVEHWHWAFDFGHTLSQTNHGKHCQMIQIKKMGCAIVRVSSRIEQFSGCRWQLSLCASSDQVQR